jgi:uncharacterized membrane protein YbhN (UPF0104 family)
MLKREIEATRHVGRRGLVAACAGTAVVAAAATPQLLGGRVADALDKLGGADPAWLWLAALGFLCSLAGSALAWQAAVRLCGGRVGALDANARYAAGSLANTFLPGRVGDAVRIGLFSRSVGGDARVWKTGGAFAAIGVARAVALAGLVVGGAAAGALPLWPLAVLAGFVGVGGVLARRSRNRRAQTRIAHVLDAFRELGRDPRAGARILACIVVATIGRLGAAAAVAASLGVHAPLAAAVIIVPALDVATLVPLTPGNVGVTSGAVALALQAHGIAHTDALSVGLAFHAVETGVSLLYGIVAPLAAGTVAQRRLALAAASTACLAVAVAFGATVIAPAF